MKWRWPSRTNLKKLVTYIAGKNTIGSVLEQLSPVHCRTRAESESLPMQTPKIVTARKLEAQVQSVAITAFAPSHDALNSLARIHSLHFHQLPDHDWETARECRSMLAQFSYQCLFRTSLTGRFK